MAQLQSISARKHGLARSLFMDKVLQVHAERQGLRQRLHQVASIPPETSGTVSPFPYFASEDGITLAGHTVPTNDIHERKGSRSCASY